MDKYCKLYVQTTDKRIIEEIIKFSIELMNLDETDISFYIDGNEEKDNKKAAKLEDGFLYYNYLVEVDSDNLSIDNLIEFINEILKQLIKKRMKVVPSCNYEEKLFFYWRS